MIENSTEAATQSPEYNAIFASVHKFNGEYFATVMKSLPFWSQLSEETASQLELSLRAAITPQIQKEIEGLAGKHVNSSHTDLMNQAAQPDEFSIENVAYGICNGFAKLDLNSSPKLNRGARMLGTGIMRLSNKYSYCFASVDYLARKHNCGTNTIYDWRKVLFEAELFEVGIRTIGGKRKKVLIPTAKARAAYSTPEDRKYSVAITKDVAEKDWSEPEKAVYAVLKQFGAYYGTFRNLAKRADYSERSVEDSVKALEKRGEIAISGCKKERIITIKNGKQLPQIQPTTFSFQPHRTKQSTAQPGIFSAQPGLHIIPDCLPDFNTLSHKSANIAPEGELPAECNEEQVSEPKGSKANKTKKLEPDRESLPRKASESKQEDSGKSTSHTTTQLDLLAKDGAADKKTSKFFFGGAPAHSGVPSVPDKPYDGCVEQSDAEEFLRAIVSENRLDAVTNRGLEGILAVLGKYADINKRLPWRARFDDLSLLYIAIYPKKPDQTHERWARLCFAMNVKIVREALEMARDIIKTRLEGMWAPVHPAFERSMVPHFANYVSLPAKKRANYMRPLRNWSQKGVKKHKQNEFSSFRVEDLDGAEPAQTPMLPQDREEDARLSECSSSSESPTQHKRELPPKEHEDPDAYWEWLLSRGLDGGEEAGCA
jgi:hypothetical protein